VDSIFSQALKLLGLIRVVITFSFSTVRSLFISYFTVVTSELEYVFVAWNTLTTADTSKLERFKRKFLVLCYSRFCPQIHLPTVTRIP
jgi:hypothetical protein